MMRFLLVLAALIPLAGCNLSGSMEGAKQTDAAQSSAAVCRSSTAPVRARAQIGAIAAPASRSAVRASSGAAAHAANRSTAVRYVSHAAIPAGPVVTVASARVAAGSPPVVASGARFF